MSDKKLELLKHRPYNPAIVMLEELLQKAKAGEIDSLICFVGNGPEFEPYCTSNIVCGSQLTTALWLGRLRMTQILIESQIDSNPTYMDVPEKPESDA